MKVLIADSVSEKANAIFAKSPGIMAETKTGLSEEELVALIPEFDALVVRSATKVTAGILDVANKLKVVGRAGSGVDNIDVKAATRKGVIVMNTPGANTISAAEHSMALLLSLSRNVPQAHGSVRAGHWERKKYLGVELRGKVLGVVGLGNIGMAVAQRAQGFDMQVLGCDPFVSDEVALKHRIQLAGLEEMLSQADFVSLHVPSNPETKHLISKQSLAKCKRGIRIVNCARGGVVDEEALAEAIDKGIVAGAALDVFEKEPPDAEHPLLKSDKVILTPHLGASTEEAQETVAVLVAEQIVDALTGKGVRNAVNVPSIAAKEMEELQSFLTLAETIGKLQCQIAEGQMHELRIQFQGDFGESRTGPITTAVVKGMLKRSASSGMVNDVNARALASERGLKVQETFSASAEDYVHLLAVTCVTSKGTHLVEGTVFGKNDVRIVTIDGFRLNAVAEGNALIYTNDDRPGMISGVTTVLAESKVNIASMYLAREIRGGTAMVLINVDCAVTGDVLGRLRALEGVREIRAVDF